MADIFISYAREDQPTASQLADALEGAGWQVWWDRDIPIGKDYDLVIDSELANARCVIVLWTQDSIRSRNVKDEANEALNAEKLLPVQIGTVRPPMGFRMIQSMVWADALVHNYVGDLLREVQRTIGTAITNDKPEPALQVAAEPKPKVPQVKPVPPRRKPPRKEKKAPAPAVALTEKRLSNLLHKYAPMASMFYAPYIPDGKEANARKSCFIPEGEVIVGLMDLTVFGAADDCIAFTTTRLFHHNLSTQPVFVDYADLVDGLIMVKSDSFFSKSISINNYTIDMSGCSEPLPRMVSLLRDIGQLLKSAR